MRRLKNGTKLQHPADMPQSGDNSSLGTSYLPNMASISSTLTALNDSLNTSDTTDAVPSVTTYDNLTSHISTSPMPFVVAGGPSEPSSYLCEGRWLPVNHLYFQLANVFLFLSYLAPNGTYGILYLRVMLSVGCFFFSLWGWVILCAFDTFLWNAFFVVINLGHAVVISYSLRPVRFSAELEQVYVELFAPLRVSRSQYKRALDCMKLIRHVRFQEIFAQEKITRVDCLSLVLSGRLVISQAGRALHIVAQHQFLDSPEWFGVSSDEFFQVSATAIEDSRVLVWHRDKLKLSISCDPFLVAVFDHILGRDVVKKLMQVNETLNKHQLSNGLCGASPAAGAPASPPLPSPEVPLPGVSAVGTRVLPPLEGAPAGDCHDPGVTEDQFSSAYTSESKPLLVALRKTPSDDGGSAPSITSILTRQIADMTRSANSLASHAADSDQERMMLTASCGPYDDDDDDVDDSDA